MMNDEAASGIHRCGVCGKPTPEKLAHCRQCKASLHGGPTSDWWSRTFSDAAAAKVLAFFAVLGLFYWIGSAALDHMLDKPHRHTAATAPDVEAGERDYDKEIADLDEQQKGFHCLSRIDGSQPELVEAVKRGLRDPDSYQHIETRITPLDATGKHNLMMHYRARNGFGGMMDGVVTATVDPSTCKVHVLESE